MNYFILLISILFIGCNTPNTYEQEALKEAKRTTSCAKPRIAVSSMVNQESHFIKVDACGKYMDYICVSEGPFSCQPVRCLYIREESKPTEDAGKIK